MTEIHLLMEKWREVKAQLETLFKNREFKKTFSLMESGIELYIQFLLLANDQPLILQSIPYTELCYKPINVQERLSFIQSRPNLYQSFRQLCELMVEQEKVFAKKTIQIKASRPNG